ncbi:unnamed protein product [marine sediment metagenome]|uniref:Uncharacterized protein n=1 Tax=marine sediment metagenome TaxID=412755 RepID=X1BJN9_9ZZZZ
MGEWTDWSDWLREGYFVSYLVEGIRYYEHIVQRDLGHWEYAWPETISAESESGPFIPEALEITRGFDARTNTNRIWQTIFGIKGQSLIYIELPTDLHRHGIPKDPKPSSANRFTSHFEEYMTPFYEPTFLTEHFMVRPWTQQIAFDAYNPDAIDDTDLRLNILIAKCATERIGTVEGGVLIPSAPRWTETLDKLYRRVIPHRPLTIQPVRAPAEAPAGQ